MGNFGFFIGNVGFFIKNNLFLKVRHREWFGPGRSPKQNVLFLKDPTGHGQGLGGPQKACRPGGMEAFIACKPAGQGHRPLYARVPPTLTVLCNYLLLCPSCLLSTVYFLLLTFILKDKIKVRSKGTM